MALFHIVCFDEMQKLSADERLRVKHTSSNHRMHPTAEDLFKRLGHCGIEWILMPTHFFEVMIKFLKQIFDYSMVTQGVPTNEHNYSRYALFSSPNGITLELLEISKDLPGQFKAPLVSFTVKDLQSSIDLLEQQGIERLSKSIGSKSWAWTYFHMFTGSIFQLQGPR